MTRSHAPPLPHPCATDAFVAAEVGIQSRRYLGAKTRLLDFLDAIVEAEIGTFSSLADLFAGTGVVADRFNRPDVRIVAADLLLSNVMALRCFLTSWQLDLKRIDALLAELNSLRGDHNYFSEHFGNRYFSQGQAQRIGQMRERISIWRTAGVVNEQEEAVLLTSLLYAADRIANTCGHYDAFRQALAPATELRLLRPRIDLDANHNNLVLCGDANRFVSELDVDILYLDPPYNSRQYSDTYHVLENLIRWDKPAVIGKARKMDRRSLKSMYSSSVRAAAAFEKLISNARCRHILVSYNNMGSKGDARSNACIPDSRLVGALELRGAVEVFEQPFPHFSTGRREIPAHTERVFYCRVNR